MTDAFYKDFPQLDSPATSAFQITSSDSTVFPQPTRAVYVGSTGDLKVMFANRYNSNTVVTFPAVPAGSVLPIRVQMVYATGTTANGVVGMF